MPTRVGQVSDEIRSETKQPKRYDSRTPEQREEDATLMSAGTDYEELPGRHITVNQVVAYNMAYFRKVAGLTQEELGQRLTGWTSKPWSKAAVSAAERSWDGKRIRQFDADLIYGLARALSVPVSAFFLPPDIDGVKERYRIDPPHVYSEDEWAGRPAGEREQFYGKKTLCSTMHDLADFALSEPSDDDDETMLAYRSRLSTIWAMYYGGDYTEGLLEDVTVYDQVLEQAKRLRGHYDAIREISGDLGVMLERTYERLARARKEKEKPEEVKS